MSTIDRTNVPDYAFEAHLVGWEARPDAPESWAATVERMARAIYVEGGATMWLSRRYAEAALRVVTEPADPT